MVTLIIGGSGSGKSAYAEAYITAHSEGRRKYYLATMQVFDKEGQKKIDRHREQRSGKGFVTIEQPTVIEKALNKMGEEEERIVLLECMSNLAANEMFSQEIPKTAEQVAVQVIKGIEVLKKEVQHLVIVSNNVFEDGLFYDETTMEYIQALGKINENLAGIADKVIEVVVGIPIVIKGGE